MNERDMKQLAIDTIDRRFQSGNAVPVERATVLASEWNELRAALLAAPAAPASAQPWLPIETAPKDGRTILLGRYNELGKWRTMRGQWVSQDCIDETWEDPTNGEPGWFETCVENDELPSCWSTNPTHWMPLPGAPEAA